MFGFDRLWVFQARGPNKIAFLCSLYVTVAAHITLQYAYTPMRDESIATFFLLSEQVSEKRNFDA